MRVVRAAGIGILGVSALFAKSARAQPQDDAALADSEEHIPAATSGSTLWPSRPEPKPEEEDSEPVLTTAELGRAYPDLELRTAPSWNMTVIGQGIYPFQAVAIGLGVDAYPIERLRLSAVATGGVIPAVNDRWTYSLYGELGLGIVVARWASQTVVELPVIAARYYRPRRGPVARYFWGDDRPTGGPMVRALVPSSHSLELEGGAFTGRYPYYRCVADCDEDPSQVAHANEDASKQLVFLYAGVRYVYYRWARSAQAPFRSLGWFEASVDAVTNPAKPDDAQLFNPYDSPPSHGPIGVRVKLRIPAIKCIANGPCLGFDVMGGYLPSPADALASINLVGAWPWHQATHQVED